MIIVGAGFAGLSAARALADESVDVLLLDRNNYHTFLPLLYQVAAAELGPAEIAYPVRSIFRRQRNLTFRMARVLDIDPDGKEVTTSEGRYTYDFLVLGPGSVPNFLGVPGAEDHAFPLRDMEHAVPLRHHILTCFERAAADPDPAHRRELLTFTIVGGGATGVEFAGALAELVYGPLRRDFPVLDLDAEVRIILLEAGDRLLVAVPEGLSAYAAAELGRRGVEVRTGCLVRAVAPDRVVLQDGEEIATDTVVWSAGVKAPRQLSEWGLPVVRDGRIRALDTLQVPLRPEIFVAGDAAYLEHEGAPIPGVAPAALQEGAHAALNVMRLVRRQTPLPFRFRDPGILAVVGRNTAVAHLGERAFKGFFAWALWLVIHVAKLIGFRNRALVLVNWAWNYLLFERSVRLILPYAGSGRPASPDGSSPGGSGPPPP